MVGSTGGVAASGVLWPTATRPSWRKRWGQVESNLGSQQQTLRPLLRSGNSNTFGLCGRYRLPETAKFAMASHTYSKSE